MGESPQEKAARMYSSNLGAMAQQYGAGGQEYYMNRMAKMDPYYSKALESVDIGKLLAGVAGGAQMSSLRGTAGANLVESGVAPGGQIGGAFISEMAPAAGGIAEVQSRLEASKANIYGNQAGMLQTLMGMGDQSIMQLLGMKGQGIGMMKDTTGFGDFMGALQSIATIGGAVAGLPFGLGGGSGLGPSPMPATFPAPGIPNTGYRPRTTYDVPFANW